MPSAHPNGPIALAVDLRDDSFTVAAFELTGRSIVLDRQEREAGSGTGMLADVADRLKVRRREFGGRVIGIGVAVPSPLSGGRWCSQPCPNGRTWTWPRSSAAIREYPGPVLTGNDATLAGLAEARRGVLRGVPVALHLHVATGIGGVLLAGGLPVTGAHGSAGEFGHMPLTGGSEPCRCGSVGCWELDAGARGLLRAVGQPEEGDRMVRAEQVIAAAATDPSCGRALTHAAGPSAAASARWSTRRTRRRSACPGWPPRCTRPTRTRSSPATCPP